MRGNIIFPLVYKTMPVTEGEVAAHADHQIKYCAGSRRLHIRGSNIMYHHFIIHGWCGGFSQSHQTHLADDRHVQHAQGRS